MGKSICLYLLSAILLCSCKDKKTEIKTEALPLIVDTTTNSFIPPDSLKKYSYRLSGYIISPNSIQPFGGTCFFVKKYGKVFLVTAKHVITGCNDKNEKTLGYPSKMSIVHEDTSTQTAFSIQIDISELQKKYGCLPSEIDLDAVAFEIIDSNAHKLFSVENFIKPPFEKIDNIEMFGFPGEKDIKDGMLVYGSASHFHLNGSGSLFASPIIDSSTRKVVDSLNWYINNDSITLNINSHHGYSGSPIFLKDLNSKNWRICGIYSGLILDATTEKPKALLVPKFEQLIF